MGFFGKREDDDRPRNPDRVFLFRALAVGYAFYMEYKIVQMYINGEADAGFWFLILSLLLLGGGGLFILISSFISWRREKAELAAQELQLVDAQDDDEPEPDADEEETDAENNETEKL